MKKPIKRVLSRKPPDDRELRRWCIEQAARWPVFPGGGGGVYSGGSMYREVEADLLGRAEKILQWVTK
jgi:hypothetical protein